MIDVVEYLAAVAYLAAQEAEITAHIDRSTRSEAVYVKLLVDGYWYGLRIASHTPYYKCSADYEQLTVPRHMADVFAIRQLEERVKKFVASPTIVVADPHLVEKELQLARHKNSGRALSGAQESAVRHRQNHLARWVHDEERAAKANSAT